MTIRIVYVDFEILDIYILLYPVNYRDHLIYFICMVVIDLTGLPMIVVASASLFSKITPEETQGFPDT